MFFRVVVVVVVVVVVASPLPLCDAFAPPSSSRSEIRAVLPATKETTIPFFGRPIASTTSEDRYTLALEEIGNEEFKVDVDVDTEIEVDAQVDDDVADAQVDPYATRLKRAADVTRGVVRRIEEASEVELQKAHLAEVANSVRSKVAEIKEKVREAEVPTDRVLIPTDAQRTWRVGNRRATAELRPTTFGVADADVVLRTGTNDCVIRYYSPEGLGLKLAMESTPGDAVVVRNYAPGELDAGPDLHPEEHLQGAGGAWERVPPGRAAHRDAPPGGALATISSRHPVSVEIAAGDRILEAHSDGRALTFQLDGNIRVENVGEHPLLLRVEGAPRPVAARTRTRADPNRVRVLMPDRRIW